MEGRKEKRNSARLPVLLSSLAQPLSAEQASTKDVTSYGMRVETGRPWELGTIVLLKSTRGELLARARVVYCKPAEPRVFTLGLEFVRRTSGVDDPLRRLPACQCGADFSNPGGA